MTLRLLLMAFAVLLLSFPGTLRAETSVFSSRGGVAIGGYDVVAYFETGTAVPGHRGHAVMWKGAVWRFATVGNQARFESNPRAYAPAFGGYCAYAMSLGLLKAGSPQQWVITDGELFLLNNPAALAAWSSSQPEMIAGARLHWPVILKK